MSSGAIPMDAKEPRAAEAGGVTRAASDFARAERHSRRVRRMKIMLPAAALLGMAGFIGWSWLSIPTLEGVSVDGAAVSDGKLVMANPKLDGFTRDDLPYSMTAERAIQDLKNTGVIQLENIDARLPLNAQTSATVVAQSGVYDNAKNTLVVDSAITLTTSDGLEAKFQSADLDMKAGTMRTEKPVDIRMDGTHISAQTMNVAGNGDVIVFERQVRVEIQPKAAAGKDATAGSKTGTGEPNAAQ